MSLTKQSLVNKVHAQSGLTWAKSRDLLESLLELIKVTFDQGEDLLISGFGKFEVRQKDARRGRNPYTGESIMLRPRRVLLFKASRILKNKFR